MFGLYRNLKARGAQNVYLLRIPFSRGAIDRMADALTQEIEKLSAQIGDQRPYLIAHGIAGIAARMGPSKNPGHGHPGNHHRRDTSSRHQTLHIHARTARFSAQARFSLTPIFGCRNGRLRPHFLYANRQPNHSRPIWFIRKECPKPAGVRPLEYLVNASLADQILSEIAAAQAS